MAVEMMPCPKCGSADVIMMPTDGGRGSGEPTSYEARCQGCGYAEGGFPSNCDGRRDTAIREWNRFVKKKAAS